MKLINFYSYILLFLVISMEISAQDVAKNIVVEHFTNTRCGICASRNPSFYNVLHQNPEVIHIAFHPSAPYSNCFFNTQNKIQNDARPKYYGAFGSTPRFFINGVEKSGQATSSTVFNEFKNQITPVDLRVHVAKAGNDEIEVSCSVETKSQNSIGSVNYFMALVEDTVFYDAPNGEKMHKDVFRKSLSDNILPSFMIPQNTGNKYEFRDVIKTEAGWDLSRIYAIVILTDSNKKVVQASRSNLYNPAITSAVGIDVNFAENVSLYPNPVSTELFIKSEGKDMIQKICILNISGNEVMEIKPLLNPTVIPISSLVSGTYFLKVFFENKVTFHKFTKI